MANKEVILPPLDEKHSPNQGTRNGAKVIKFVVHVTVGSYESALNWMMNPKAQVSSHLVLNLAGDHATQLVGYNEMAWTQAEANPFCESLEMAGFPDKEPTSQLKVAARIVAFRLHKRGLPARYSPEWETPGFCRHGDLGVRGGDHPSCPMTREMFISRFVPMVHHEAARGNFRPEWGRD